MTEDQHMATCKTPQYLSSAYEKHPTSTKWQTENVISQNALVVKYYVLIGS